MIEIIVGDNGCLDVLIRGIGEGLVLNLEILRGRIIIVGVSGFIEGDAGVNTEILVVGGFSGLLLYEILLILEDIIGA